MTIYLVRAAGKGTVLKTASRAHAIKRCKACIPEAQAKIVVVPEVR